MSKINRIKVQNIYYDVEDSEVPSWAKQNAKPTYTFDEIQNKPSIVNQVNNKTGNVTLTPADIGIDLSNYEQLTNKTTTIDENSTNTQYPSAKAVYDKVGPIELILDEIIQGALDGDNREY